MISLKRSVVRRQRIEAELTAHMMPFTFVDAVDGRTLSAAARKRLIDQEAVARSPEWLTDAALGCSLSHRLAYGKLLESGEHAALILEDDVRLMDDLPVLLEQVEPLMDTGEVLLLNFRSFAPCRLHLGDAVQVGRYQLMRPVTMRSVISAAGYVIGADVAARMYEEVIPVSLTADSWADHIDRGHLDALRCVLPRPVEHTDVESTLGYSDRSALYSAVRHIRIWPLPALRAANRRRIARRMTRVELVD